MRHLLIVITLLLTGCAPSMVADIHKSKDTFYLEVTGHGFSDRDKMKEALFMRSVELCGSNNFDLKYKATTLPYAVLGPAGHCDSGGFCTASQRQMPAIIGSLQCKL